MSDVLALHHGDCIEVLLTIPDASVDAVVTDPPYLIEFMGRRWDSARGIAGQPEVWAECLRVLKPGGHLLAFGAPRTYHRMACAIEDGGFEIRDSLHWVYGSGFPKSLDVSKSIEGVVRGRGARYSGRDEKLETLANQSTPGELWDAAARRTMKGQEAAWSGATVKVTTPEARLWEGWGTALKPAHEPIVLARKPFAGTVAANVQQHGTGAINIEASRVASSDALVRPPVQRTDNMVFGPGLGVGTQAEPSGRWPPNLLLSHTAGCADAVCDEGCAVVGMERQNSGAARFFPTFRYQAKASRSERGEGNTHPTVKPVALMEWLVSLITPRGGTVLDPFMGSGTTGIAAIRNGYRFVGIEKATEYFDIARERILSVTTTRESIDV